MSEIKTTFSIHFRINKIHIHVTLEDKVHPKINIISHYSMKSTEVLNPRHSAQVICGYAKLSMRLCVRYPASIVPYKSKMAAALCVEGEGRTARSLLSANPKCTALQ